MQYIWPIAETWANCTHEEKLMWAIRVLQQEVAGKDRVDFPELPQKTQEAIILCDFAIEDA